MTEQIDTDEQKAIFEFIAKGEGHLLVEALAGTGKTSTAIRSLQFIPQRSVLMCAFNKPIAEELQARMGTPPPGRMWKAATFHSCGLKIVQARQRIEVRPEATEDLINEAAAEWEMNQSVASSRGVRCPFGVRRVAVKLLRTLKETCTEREVQPDRIRSIGETFDLFQKLKDDEITTTIFVVSRAYYYGQDLKARRSIDFCDMTWLPVVLDLPPPGRFQVVFIDEAQDLSMPQLQLVKKLVAPNGRLVAIGDLNQSVYRWRGAVGEEVWREMKETFKATSLPLTTTFRCSKAVVREANRVVPELRAQSDAPEGDVYNCSFESLPKLLRQFINEGSTFVLSRNNADLLHTSLYLWKAGIGFQLRAGKEIVEPLYEIIDKLDKSTTERFTSSLTTWYQIEMGKAEGINATAWADRIEQQYKSLMLMLGYAQPREFRGILQDILELSAMSPITLSTVHKVKGLEADRVFLLKQTFARGRYEHEIESAIDPWLAERARERLANIDQEEMNLEYVAITRAKRDLYWVDMRGTGTMTLAKLYDIDEQVTRARQALSKSNDDGFDVGEEFDQEALDRAYDDAARVALNRQAEVITDEEAATVFSNSGGVTFGGFGTSRITTGYQAMTSTVYYAKTPVVSGGYPAPTYKPSSPPEYVPLDDEDDDEPRKSDLQRRFESLDIPDSPKSKKKK